LSIVSLIANTIQGKQIEVELDEHRNTLKKLIEDRTYDLSNAINLLKKEIEEHESTQKTLINSKEKFRKLSHQIQSVREEEKSRIAREVHDQLGQALTALKIDTIQIEKKSRRNYQV
jgi:two-component system, sensor histidine kinase